jgi:parvulin-like peptidyl-prolyl isomerase
VKVSQPVVSRFGVHLIQLIDRREVKLSDAQKREAARSVLRERASSLPTKTGPRAACSSLGGNAR